MRLLKFFNGKILLPSGIQSNGCLIVKGDKIAEITSGPIDIIDAESIDLNGSYLMPGFIDIHIHGGGDSDFMDGTVDGFIRIAETHARFGTTTMMPTTLSSTREELVNTLESYSGTEKLAHRGSKFAGLHIEGPYFAMAQRGAQDPRFVRNPDPAEYKEIVSSYRCIRRWSAAPELPGALEFGKYLLEKGILPSFAHTEATHEDIVKALGAGYTLATHLYSGMLGVTRRNAFRYAGAVESTMVLDEIDAEIIADGVHLPAPLLQLVYKTKGASKVALITDAMRAAAMPPGKSRLGSKSNGLDVIVEDGVAKLPDRTSFAGSVATTDRLLRTMVEIAGIPLTDAVTMASSTPARIIGIDKQTGSLEVGKSADLVVMNDQLQVQSVYINGNKVV
ncbi:MAG: N-acetylglucosamine-6-phosphate deacetylase [Bacteroidetes bacterium]|nr:N-acetylglucosamine-6-phosphate deacetylase [Bacteroidota bacterium]